MSDENLKRNDVCALGSAAFESAERSVWWLSDGDPEVAGYLEGEEQQRYSDDPNSSRYDSYSDDAFNDQEDFEDETT